MMLSYLKHLREVMSQKYPAKKAQHVVRLAQKDDTSTCQSVLPIKA